MTKRAQMTVADAKQQLDAMVQRKLEQRRKLADAALVAGVADVDRVQAELEAGRRPWWPELAPLTTAERATVYRSIVAGLAAGKVADHDD